MKVLSYKVGGCVSLPEITGMLISISCRALDRFFAARLKCITCDPALTETSKCVHVLVKKLVIKFRIYNTANFHTLLVKTCSAFETF